MTTANQRRDADLATLRANARRRRPAIGYQNPANDTPLAHIPTRWELIRQRLSQAAVIINPNNHTRKQHQK